MTKRVREDGIPTQSELSHDIEAFKHSFFQELCKAVGQEKNIENFLELLKMYHDEVQVHCDDAHNITDEIQRRMGESLEKLRKNIKSE